MEFKQLVRDTAWKNTLVNPFTKGEFKLGDRITVHNHKTGKLYPNTEITLVSTSFDGPLNVPKTSLFIWDNIEGKSILLTEDFFMLSKYE